MLKINDEYVNKVKHWFSGYVEIFKNGDDDLLQNTILKEKHTKKYVKTY